MQGNSACTAGDTTESLEKRLSDKLIERRATGSFDDMLERVRAFPVHEEPRSEARDRHWTGYRDHPKAATRT
jgi:hypothetical protein